VNENRIKNFDNMARSINKDIDLVRDDMLKLDKKTNENKYWLTDLQKRMDKLEDNNELSKKFIAVVDSLRNEFRFIETYIDKYMPLFVQAQISDTLNSFVSGRSRKALCIY
jgi:Mg2+ and Co2+ transporter CorA